MWRRAEGLQLICIPLGGPTGIHVRNRVKPTLLIVAAVLASLGFSTSGCAQVRQPTPEIDVAQRLHQAVSKKFETPFVEAKLGTLRTGGRVAQVVIADSALFHAEEEVQRSAARRVAKFVKSELRDEADLRTVRIGWKYAPAGGMSTTLTHEFATDELGADAATKPS